VHERYRRQTDRQRTDRQTTDGRATAYSEREREFTFAKNVDAVRLSCYSQWLRSGSDTGPRPCRPSILEATSWQDLNVVTGMLASVIRALRVGSQNSVNLIQRLQIRLRNYHDHH